MIRTAIELDPEGDHLSWQGPAVFIETVRLKKQGDQVRSLTMLDMVNHAFAPSSTAPAEAKMRWGLAVCAAEGQLLDNHSVNHHLISGDQPIKAITESNGDDLLANAVADESLVLSRASSNRYAWIVKSDGNLLGIITERPLLQAKGGESRGSVAPVGAAVYSTIGSAALAAGGASPLGPLVGGIAGYLNELRKAYEGAAGKINHIADLIGGGGGGAPKKDGYDFSKLAENLVTAMGKGYAKGYVSSVLSTGSGALINAGPGGKAVLTTGIGGPINAATLDPNDIRAAFGTN